MSELSKQPYKGTRDFYPKEMAVQKYIFTQMRNAVESFGYVEYDAPLLEESNLYRAKSGDEIANEQTYSFTDRGGREVTIRPEMTPTVARMVASKRKALNFPLRWYSIPNLWRYERPQRGRLREHWQLNVDLIGSDSVTSDIEIVSVADHIMKTFNAPKDSYAINVNNRKLINALMFDHLKLNDEQAHKTIKLIDRKNKIEADKFTEDLISIVGEESAKELNSVFKNVEEKGLKGLPETLLEKEEVKNLIDVIEKLKSLNITSVFFDITLMRGFDYYTGIVFEVFDTNPINRRSIFGGGRYDELVSIFDVEPVSAIGFGMGDVVIADFLETYNLIPETKSKTKLYICTFNKSDTEYQMYAQQLAKRLRAEGISVMVDISTKKIAKQIKIAANAKIPYTICIGENEIKESKFKLKNLEESSEKVLTESELLEELK